MERYHAASVLSLTARHPARARRAPNRTVNAAAPCRVRVKLGRRQAVRIRFTSDCHPPPLRRGEVGVHLTQSEKKKKNKIKQIEICLEEIFRRSSSAQHTAIDIAR